ncbi:hypothetical protein [Rhizobium laguerreae]|uniref:hypothetical protein n=1 Tax=Rhizobium laguerreae TaxID=1076926 RepID=UPI001C9064FC|nr:hypothetical protein [Rhizobium laguerreae]MBY3348991.1 hypothetical protein [Rhizobium laguerreae]MBY3356079.1 hypothetical protein [Rhizobium laguerreae]MBY3369998.1 hypothetical protein [Rhizobium laguerreae]MBY3377140.1 hypothetical protein [Rhizobium laguerreae]MBY3390832.1 hypothetical protein [Rhizobium laguerreae]
MAALPDVVVLIVGTHSAAEQKALRRHLQRKRSVDGDFVKRNNHSKKTRANHETR